MGFPRPRLGGRVMRCLGAACAPALLAAALLCWAPQASAAIPAWTTYHHDGARSGIDPDSTTPLPPARLWQTGALDGSVWGEPLVYGSTVYVATENDTIYALDAGTGALRWEAHLGMPVPSSELECGDISPTVGITSTPVIDPVTNTIYAVTDTWDGSDPATIHHFLVALDLSTGAMRPNFPLAVDPPFPAGRRRRAPAPARRIGAGQRRGGDRIRRQRRRLRHYLGLAGGGAGERLGARVSLPGGRRERPSRRRDLGSGNAPAVDGAGYLYAATGNGYSGGHFDDSESVLRLEADMRLVEVWAPRTGWNSTKATATSARAIPSCLPNGLVFQIGKSGEARAAAPRRLRRGRRHAGGLDPGLRLLGRRHLRPGGATSGTLYITCLGSGLHAIAVNELNAPEPQLSELAGWSVPGEAIGPPIYAGGLIWSTHWNNTVEEEGGVLYGIDPRTGEVKVQEELGAFEHFATPAAGGGRLFVANNDRVTALDVAVPPAPTPTTTTLTRSAEYVNKGQPVTLTAAVSPVPDSGTVAFSASGKMIPGCGEVHLSLTSGGRATCETSFGQAGIYTLAASYSGDAYYAPSRSAEPAISVSEEAAVSRGLLSGLGESHKRWREGTAAPRISAPAQALRAGGAGTRAGGRRSARRSASCSPKRRPCGSPSRRRCVDALWGGAAWRSGSCAVAHALVWRRCTRTLTVATLRLSGHPGVDRVRFEGRVSHQKVLRPGRYTLLVVACTPSGARSPGQRVSFRIVNG